MIEPTQILKEIELDSIELDPAQPRKDFDDLKTQDLADKLWAQGLIQPIVVIPLGEARQLHVGARRFMSFLKNRERARAELSKDDTNPLALRYNAWTVIPAIIDTAPLPDYLRRLAQISENTDREPLSLLETAEGYVEAQAMSGLNAKDFCKAAAVHSTRFSKLKACADAAKDDSVAAYALRRNLFKDCHAIAPFLKLPPAHQEALVAEAEKSESTITPVHVQTLLDAIRDAKKKAKSASKAPKPEPPPPPPSGTSPTNGGSSDAPAISAAALAWLVGHLETLNAGEAEDHRVALLQGLSEALNAGSAVILVREASFHLRESPSSSAAPLPS